jgi:hypothetical protein
MRLYLREETEDGNSNLLFDRASFLFKAGNCNEEDRKWAKTARFLTLMQGLHTHTHTHTHTHFIYIHMTASVV